MESNARNETTESSNFESSRLLSENTAGKKDILQQALKNSGLPSKNKTCASEGTHIIHYRDKAIVIFILVLHW